MADSGWLMHWSESAVFDANAVALGVELSELMISAGASLASEVSSGVKDKGGLGEVWFLCGPGNNGGDGFVAASALYSLWFDLPLNVRILASHAQQKSDISQDMRNTAKSAGVSIHSWQGNGWSIPIPRDRKVLMLVDCLLGVGPQGPGTPALPRDSIGEVMDWLMARFEVQFPLILACDVPTGLCSSKQMNVGRTLTFHAPKMGLLDELGGVANGVGGIKVASLPWPDETINPGIGDLLRFPALKDGAIKGDRGRVLVIGGGPYHGAPILSGMAAARMGADLIHVAMPSSASARVSWPTELIPEKIVDEEILSLKSVSTLEQRMRSGRGVQAIVIGPGLGDAEETLDAVRELLVIATVREIPIVIDADAIKALPKKNMLAGLKVVITPHSKELESWLEGIECPEILESVMNESNWRKFTPDEENAVIIETGAVDHIWGLNGRYCQSSGGSARMAMGGTGDLLAGAIGGLLAIGMAPWPAARLASYLLREAGKMAEAELGIGMVASDIPLFLAKALAYRAAM